MTNTPSAQEIIERVKKRYAGCGTAASADSGSPVTFSCDKASLATLFLYAAPATA